MYLPSVLFSLSPFFSLCQGRDFAIMSSYCLLGFLLLKSLAPDWGWKGKWSCPFDVTWIWASICVNAYIVDLSKMALWHGCIFWSGHGRRWPIGSTSQDFPTFYHTLVGLPTQIWIICIQSFTLFSHLLPIPSPMLWWYMYCISFSSSAFPPESSCHLPSTPLSLFELPAVYHSPLELCISLTVLLTRWRCPSCLVYLLLHLSADLFCCLSLDWYPTLQHHSETALPISTWYLSPASVFFPKSLPSSSLSLLTPKHLFHLVSMSHVPVGIVSSWLDNRRMSCN